MHRLEYLNHEPILFVDLLCQMNDVFKPLMTLMRETQNGSNYLQADETRIQVLKEIFLQR